MLSTLKLSPAKALAMFFEGALAYNQYNTTQTTNRYIYILAIPFFRELKNNVIQDVDLLKT